MLLGNTICVFQARPEHKLTSLNKPLVRPSARLTDQNGIKGMMANPFLPARPRMRLICVGSQRQYKHLINKIAQKILKKQENHRA